MDLPNCWLNYRDEFSEILGDCENYIFGKCESFNNELLLPQLANGYIATDLTTKWLFMDGVYAGENVKSHRATIPSPVFWFPKIENLNCQKTTLVFHYGMGIFMHVQHYDGFEIYTSTFVSRARPNILVRLVEIVFIEESNDWDEITLYPDRPIQFITEDFQYNVDNYCESRLHFIGVVRKTEDPTILPVGDNVYMVTDATEGLHKTGFKLSLSKPSVCFLTSLSRSSHKNAVDAYESALAAYWSKPDTLLDEQAFAWLDIWRNGCVTFGGTSTTNVKSKSSWEVLSSNKEDSCVTSFPMPTVGDDMYDDKSVFSLQRCIIAAQYALLANFPTQSFSPDALAIPQFNPENSSLKDLPMMCSFFGASPTGLGRGDTEEDYLGHVFWDMEIWMLPWLTLFHPKMTELAFQYRFATKFASELRANREHTPGTRFPWESARTGIETSPWDLSANNELHVIADISFSIQQWLIASCQTTSIDTPALEWYDAYGRELLDSIARYWSSRIDYSEIKEAYVILGVMPPDEYTSICNNSAFTNAVVSVALSGPLKMSAMLGRPISNEHKVWDSLSKQIWMPFDKEKQVMLEYEDYKLGQTVKQADAILLSYPLMFQQTLEAKQNLVQNYASVTTMSGPAMTWSIFSICALELGNYQEAAEYFTRSILNCQMPFYVWTEERDRFGAKNFITGIGGFLQSLTYGYAGIRICLPKRSDTEESVQALFIKPQTNVPLLHYPIAKEHPQPPIANDNILNLHGLKFLGRKINLSFKGDGINIMSITLVSGQPLCLTEEKRGELKSEIQINGSNSWMIEQNKTSLKLPYGAYWLHE